MINLCPNGVCRDEMETLAGRKLCGEVYCSGRDFQGALRLSRGLWKVYTKTNVPQPRLFGFEWNMLSPSDTFTVLFNVTPADHKLLQAKGNVNTVHAWEVGICSNSSSKPKSTDEFASFLHLKLLNLVPFIDFILFIIVNILDFFPIPQYPLLYDFSVSWKC